MGRPVNLVVRLGERLTWVTKIERHDMKGAIRVGVGIACLFLVASCSERTVGVSVTGYNHTKDKYVYMFSVNGAGGPNIEPNEGGGKMVCCASLPAEWRPGMRAKIWWQYGRKNDGDPQPPPQQIELEVPNYGKRVGDIHVHFYDDDKVNLVISSCDLEHPLYPMDEKSRLPWKAKSSKEDYLKWAKKAGGTLNC